MLLVVVSLFLILFMLLLLSVADTNVDRSTWNRCYRSHIGTFFHFLFTKLHCTLWQKGQTHCKYDAVCFVGMKSKNQLLSGKIVKRRTNNKTKMIIFSCLTLIMFCSYPSLWVLHLHLRFL